MSKNAKSADLKSAYAQRELTKAAVEKIQAVLNGKSFAVLDTGVLEKARVDLEDCLARRALDEATEQDEAASRLALANAETYSSEQKRTRSAAQVEIDGLTRRLRQTQEAENLSASQLAAAKAAWLQEELMAADEAYTNAAVELELQYRRVFGCAGALTRLGFPLHGQQKYAADIEIPAIGPVSCARAGQLDQAKPHGIGAPIFRNFFINHDASTNEIILELKGFAAPVEEASPIRRIVNKLTNRGG